MCVFHARRPKESRNANIQSNTCRKMQAQGWFWGLWSILILLYWGCWVHTHTVEICRQTFGDPFSRRRLYLAHLNSLPTHMNWLSLQQFANMKTWNVQEEQQHGGDAQKDLQFHSYLCNICTIPWLRGHCVPLSSRPLSDPWHHGDGGWQATKHPGNPWPPGSPGKFLMTWWRRF